MRHYTVHEFNKLGMSAKAVVAMCMNLRSRSKLFAWQMLYLSPRQRGDVCAAFFLGASQDVWVTLRVFLLDILLYFQRWKRWKKATFFKIAHKCSLFRRTMILLGYSRRKR